MHDVKEEYGFEAPSEEKDVFGRYLVCSTTRRSTQSSAPRGSMGISLRYVFQSDHYKP